MSLQAALARARTEEDVKDAYIAALGLKTYFKGLVDIQTEEVWFEAKDSPTPSIVMFGQLLVYVRAARKRGEPIPAFLDEGRKLWTRFHGVQFPRKIRDECKLGRADAGWYQIRRALEAHGDTELTDFEPFKAAYKALSEKLRPMVYELGFLPA